jgi:DNA invertase Pin-like site-specific DNA recombinase
VTENLTFSGKADPLAELMLNMMGSFAQFERSLILARQKEGIALKKARGEYAGRGGRPATISADKVATIKARVAAGEKKTAIAADLKISRE